MPELVDREWITKFPKAKVYKARKEYLCEECDKTISIGEYYLRYTYHQDGSRGLYDDIYHIDCAEERAKEKGEPIVIMEINRFKLLNPSLEEK